MTTQTKPSIEFTEFPKIARLSRECIITEKIDGTNGQIYIGEDGEFLVGSRSRWITPEDDNYGFARWAHEHRAELLTLGPGRHFGEWWGQGVQRKYNMPEKRWSLFNVARWCLHGQEPQRMATADPRIEKWQDVLPACCHLVPVLFRGMFDTARVEEAIADLRTNGSKASPGFMKPEGVICFHVAGNFGFKKTLEKDEAPKSVVGGGGGFSSEKPSSAEREAHRRRHMSVPLHSHRAGVVLCSAWLAEPRARAARGSQRKPGGEWAEFPKPTN